MTIDIFRMILKKCLIFKKVKYLVGIGRELKRAKLIRNKQLSSSCINCKLNSVCIKYVVIGKSKTIMEYCMDFGRIYYVEKKGDVKSIQIKNNYYAI